MPVSVQVHEGGTSVIIDHENGTIGIQYPKSPAPRETHKLTDEWISKYATCRVCEKKLDDSSFAWAYFKLERKTCSSACYQAETLKRYACCDKATPRACVCSYSIQCPTHGQRCFGTHD